MIERYIHRHGTFLFCMVFAMSQMSLVQGITSNCGNVAAVEGSTTTLTCTFGDDLYKAGTNVYVDHKQHITSKLVLVASCRWTPNGHDCKTIRGYHLVGNVTKTLSIEIPNIQETHAGKYWCEIYGSDPRDRMTCDISVVGIHIHNLKKVNPKVKGNDVCVANKKKISFGTSEPTLTSTRPGGVESSVQNDSIFKDLAIAFGICVSVMFIAIVALVLKIFSLQRIWCFKDSHPEHAVSYHVGNQINLLEDQAQIPT